VDVEVLVVDGARGEEVRGWIAVVVMCMGRISFSVVRGAMVSLGVAILLMVLQCTAQSSWKIGRRVPVDIERIERREEQRSFQL